MARRISEVYNLKITFVLPELNLTGGVRVVAIYSDYLSRMGHDVTVIAPRRQSLNFFFKLLHKLNIKKSNKYYRYDDSFFSHVDRINLVSSANDDCVVESDVPDSDVIIATFWNTAEWINDFSEKKGKKFYFIQHHEIHPWLPVDRVKSTLRLPYKKIVVANWLKDVLMSEYGAEEIDIAVVHNAVDTEQFNAPARQKNVVTTFGFMYSSRSYKGSSMAIEAIHLLKKKYDDINVFAFGHEEFDDIKHILPSYVQYISRPAQEKLRYIYSSCDAWIFSSTTEGFGLPILEAMACRTPVIGTPAGAAPELLSSGGGILLKAISSEQLSKALESVVQMPFVAWEKMSSIAYEEATKHKWCEASKLFEACLRKEFNNIEK